MSAAAQMNVRGKGLAGYVLIGLFCLAVAVSTVAGGALGLALVIGLIAFTIFLRNPVIGLYATTVFVLLSGASATLGGYELGVPITLGRICGYATIAAWLVNLVVTREPVRIGWEVLTVTALAAWSLLSIVWQVEEFWSVLWPKYMRLVNVIVYFILAANLLNTRERVINFAKVIIVCGAIMSGFAVLQAMLPQLQFGGFGGIEAIGGGRNIAYIDPEGDVARVSGTLGHSNWLAFALLLILPLNLYWWNTAKTRFMRRLALSVIALELVAITLTYTRVSFIALIVLGVTGAALGVVRISPNRAVAFAVLLVVAWFLLPAGYKDRVLDFGSYRESESTRHRIQLQKHAIDYALERPIVGIGLGAYGFRLYEEDTDVARMLNILVDHFGWDPIHYGPHNFYLQIACETGFVGLLIMLFFILRTIRGSRIAAKIWRKVDDPAMAQLARAVTVSMVVFLLCAVFLHALNQKIWWMIAVLSMTLVYTARQTKADMGDLAEEPEDQ